MNVILTSLVISFIGTALVAFNKLLTAPVKDGVIVIAAATRKFYEVGFLVAFLGLLVLGIIDSL